MEIDKPKTFLDGQEMPTFNWMSTGQMILTFETPLEIVNRMNNLYDDSLKEKKLDNFSDQLVGKIKDEYSLYLDDNTDRENHNHIPDDIHEWIKDRIHQYLLFTHCQYAGIKTSSAWINDYKDKEYNPLHRHYGSAEVFKPPLDKCIPYTIGLIGMMALKVPADMGKEITNEDRFHYNRNGQVEFIGGGSGKQFSQDSILLNYQVGTFVVFPYDMLHCVYPHFNKKETRRTFPTNIDVYLQE